MSNDQFSLDDLGHIRVLPQDKYEEAERTATECKKFLESKPHPTSGPCAVL